MLMGVLNYPYFYEVLLFKKNNYNMTYLSNDSKEKQMALMNNGLGGITGTGNG